MIHSHSTAEEEEKMPIEAAMATTASRSKVAYKFAMSPGGTAAPKRRRKGKVRCSPEKKASLRNTVSGAGSLLDSADDDQESQLAGVAIRHPIDPPAYDDLSYSDSEVSTQVWEGLEEEDVDDQSVDDDGESQEVIFSEFRNQLVGPLHTKSWTIPEGIATPVSPPDHFVGGVIAIGESKTTATHNPKKRQLPKAKSFALAGRQISECSEITMPESLVSESSYDSQRSSLYPSSYFHESEAYETGSSSNSGDCVASPSARDDEEASHSTEDSGIIEAETDPMSLRSPRRKKAAHKINSRTDDTCSVGDSSTFSGDAFSWMRKYQPNPSGSAECRVPNSGAKKRKEQSSPVRHHEDSGSRYYNDSVEETLLFPLRHFTGEASERRSSFEATSDGSLKSSLLLDLTEDLKEIAIVASKNSGELVASVFHQLCEDCEDWKR